ncbi:MAG TPA: GGDEF domain-containing protein [Stellaceae bacterium]|jgi:diguanylate cyclase (GGDEF)-like protein|nr:GGDEF domain-containing protein [Stellaceae bacterium]
METGTTRSAASGTVGARRRATDPAPDAAPGVAMTPELRALVEEREALRRELADARTQIAQLERLADEDALTPIANRRAFVRELTRMIAFTKRYGVPSSVVYFDVNGMKQINDNHGHPAGDAALRLVAKALLDNVRSSDVVGRLGGDEFGVILAHTNQEQANAKADALAEAIGASPLRWGGVDIRVSAAHGVYSFAGGDDAHVAIEAADRAMYRQKRAG